MTLHFGDLRSAASLPYGNRAEITLLYARTDALFGMVFVRAQKLSIIVLPRTTHHAPRTTHVELVNSSNDEGDVTENSRKAIGLEKQNNNFRVHLAIKR